MSSSGVIYAIIVGAWAVYLVPMWLRREDELNRARDTQRYAAAIKVLANKEAFERRWAKPDEADEVLPLAVGQGFRPATSPTVSARTTPAKRPTVAAATSPATRSAVTATVAGDTARNRRNPHSSRTANPRTASAANATATATAATAPTPAQRPSATAAAAAAAAADARTHTRTGLMARRRRVVALLFTISTFGALVSADLGARYLWVMAIPAVLLSAYIVRLRREERIRAAMRTAKRAAAQEAREAEAARAQAEAVRADARAAQAEAEAMRAEAQAAAEHRRRTEVARRRASAAARARAQAFTHEAPDLPQASNG